MLDSGVLGDDVSGETSGWRPWRELDQFQWVQPVLDESNLQIG